MRKLNHLLVVSFLPVCFCLLGCSEEGEKFPDVTLDAAEVAANIMSEYDNNSDGEISKAELKKCKGLEMLTKGASMVLQELRLDSDASGSISEQEFVDKFTACFADLRAGYNCNVMYKRQPLEGATVTLVPEEFMGAGLPEASGETDRDGNCSVSTPDGLQGAVPGIYRVEITHPEAKINSKYNTNSKISIALDPTNPYANEGVPKFVVK